MSFADRPDTSWHTRVDEAAWATAFDEMFGWIEFAVGRNMNTSDARSDDFLNWVRSALTGSVAIDADGIEMAATIGFHQDAQSLLICARSPGVVSNDFDRFDTMQLALLRRLAEELLAMCRADGLSISQTLQTVADTAFDVACVIDGSTIMESEQGMRIRPILLFSSRADAGDHLTLGQRSFMHEYALGVSEEVLQVLR